MRVIYIDLAFLLNAALDYLALCCTVRFAGLPRRQLRLLSAAVLGGLYAAWAMARGETGGMLPWLAALGMVLLSFGLDRFFLRRYVLFLAVSCLLSGAVTAAAALWHRADSPLPIFLAAAAFSYGVLAVIFGGSGREEIRRVRARLCHEGRTICLTLLRDSGNLLRDPLTGESICVIWEQALRPLLMGREVLFHTVTCRSVGAEETELLYFYCDALTIEGKTYYRYPIALTNRSLSDGSGFAGLWNGGEKKEDNHAALAS